MISPDHEEEISNRYADWEMIREFRIEQLRERHVTIKEILNLIESPKKLSSIFKKKVKVDLMRLSIAGHSFGGALAIYTTMKDKRITGIYEMIYKKKKFLIKKFINSLTNFGFYCLIFQIKLLKINY